MEQEVEEILSQKLSQLSTKSEEENEEKSPMTNKRRRSSPLSSPSVVTKKMKMTDNKDTIDKDTQHDRIPPYLLATNKSFNFIMSNVMHTATSTTLDDLRQVAILIHQIAELRIDKQIKTTYLQSGTGTLRESEPELTNLDRRVWPTQVKSKMLEQLKKDSTKRTAIPAVKMTDEEEHRHCEEFVQQSIREINEKMVQYQRKLDQKKSHLVDMTSTMEEAIKAYVDQYGIRPIKMKRDLKIALIEYDYDAGIIERKYLRENPNEYQVKEIISWNKRQRLTSFSFLYN